jgi:erythromycin esterase-like protein
MEAYAAESSVRDSSWRFGPCAVAAVLLVLAGPWAQAARAQAPAAHAIDIADNADPAQYAFLSSVLKGAEVVSLAESIHMTHEFPPARIGMVRWMNEHLGFRLLAIEGSPEDLWVSQDAFLRDPTDLAESTSGLFGVWNTAEMRQLFAYEASTWRTDHPLYITAYDIQPGTGRESHGARVFQLLAQRLAQYAPAPAGFDAAAWTGELGSLSMGCGEFKPGDAVKIEADIATLQGWIDRAAPNVEAAFPGVPHAAALRLVPENLRASLALCQGYVGGGASGANLYKPTRDRNAARFALRLRETAPGQRLMLWAHVSHLFYDAEGGSTSVGEILHAALGPRLYTIGAFAESGGTIMLISDWNDIIGYGRVWGVSGALKRDLDAGCAETCFFDLRDAGAGAAVTQPERVWFEARPERMTLAKDFDGIIWVRQVHPPQMPFAELLAWCTPRYWQWLAVRLLALLVVGAGAIWIAIRISRRRRMARARAG